MQYGISFTFQLEVALQLQLLSVTGCTHAGGVNLGVMKAVGQAVQEGQSMHWGGLSSRRRIRCIGIATWGYIERNEHLISPLEGKVRKKNTCLQEV